MGSEFSQSDYEAMCLGGVYNFELQHPCLLPDVGIDESLLKYSVLDSNSVLKTYSNELISTVPDFVDKLGSSLASFKSIPNAVGLGALVLSMIMEICIKSTPRQNDDSYSMLRRVFGEEKASAVRDTMTAYLWRHRVFMNNEQRLQKEIRRLEQQLSNKLIILRNSLLHDGQMNTRGLKIWINGASFHLQMLIHEARLNQTDQHSSHYVDSVNAAITLYLQDLDTLLKKYKSYKISTTRAYWLPFGEWNDNCKILNTELNCYYFFGEKDDRSNFCQGDQNMMIEAFMNHVYSKYEPITGLKRHFSNIKNNLNSLINQHDVFTVPSTA